MRDKEHYAIAKLNYRQTIIVALIGAVPAILGTLAATGFFSKETNDSIIAPLSVPGVSPMISGFNIVEGLSIPVIVWDVNDIIVEVNTAACQFVLAPREALLGKTPAYLRARIVQLIENPNEWMQEQSDREIQTYDGFLGRPSEIPMILKDDHQVYTGSWRIETIKHEIGDDTFWVTRYFRD